jgi:hypothetical protein
MNVTIDQGEIRPSVQYAQEHRFDLSNLNFDEVQGLLDALDLAVEREPENSDEDNTRETQLRLCRALRSAVHSAVKGS